MIPIWEEVRKMGATKAEFIAMRQRDNLLSRPVPISDFNLALSYAHAHKSCAARVARLSFLTIASMSPSFRVIVTAVFAPFHLNLGPHFLPDRDHLLKPRLQLGRSINTPQV